MGLHSVAPFFRLTISRKFRILRRKTIYIMAAYSTSLSYALLTKEIRKVKLTQEELTQLHMTYFQTRSEAIKNRLVSYHLRIVIKLVGEFKTSKNVSFEDLIGYGSIGLVRALEAFEPSKGFMFTTFARPAIIREIITCLKGEDIIRIKGSHKEAIAEGTLPKYTFTSTSSEVPGFDNTTVEDMISDDTFDKLFIFDELTHEDKVDIFWSYLKELLPREDQWELMRAKYSACTVSGTALKLTDEEIGAMFGTTKANIGQKKLNIMDKLKKSPKLYEWWSKNFLVD